MRLSSISLTAAFALAFSAGVTFLTQPVAEYSISEPSIVCRKDREVERDPRKAARAKKKALREEGVKSVRVKSPSGWPTQIPVPEEVELTELPAKPGAKGYYYESNCYRFCSPVKLSEATQHMVGRLFECTYAANMAIAEVLPVPRTSESREKKKFNINFARNMQDYYRMGGPQGSAGVFRHSKVVAQDGAPRKLSEKDIVSDDVLVPFTSLGLDDNGRIVEEDIDTHTLVHEITHQNFVLNNLPIWLNEGWAEYVGYVPYMGEELDFNRGFSIVLHEAKKRMDHEMLDYPFQFKVFFTMSQEDMYAHMGTQKDTYMLSCMLVSFFVHLDGKRGVEALRAYMEDLIEGVPNEEALEKLTTPYKGMTGLERAFDRAWKRKKVEPSFEDPDGKKKRSTKKKRTRR